MGLQTSFSADIFRSAPCVHMLFACSFSHYMKLPFMTISNQLCYVNRSSLDLQWSPFTMVEASYKQQSVLQHHRKKNGFYCVQGTGNLRLSNLLCMQLWRGLVGNHHRYAGKEGSLSLPKVCLIWKARAQLRGQS